MNKFEVIITKIGHVTVLLGKSLVFDLLVFENLLSNVKMIVKPLLLYLEREEPHTQK